MKGHKYKSGAKTKGYIKNNVTGKTESFQYNPTTLEYSRGTTYSEIVAPGMPYPITQYTHGNAREFSVVLFMNDNPCTGKIKKFEKFLSSFLTPEKNKKGYTKPPDMTFCMGYFIKKCVLVDLAVAVDMFDSEGKATQATFTLQLRQVGV